MKERIRGIPTFLIALLLFATVCLSSKRGRTDGRYVLRALKSCAEFVSNDELGEIFETLEESYPEIAEALVIGNSVEGRPIHALRLSKDPTVEEAEPEARIVGAIHGDECMSAEVVLTAAQWLVDDYSNHAEFATRLIEGAEITLVPLLNPDGYEAETAKRKNANDVDLNRNLHFAWIGEGGMPFSEPETLALKQLSEMNNFNIGISFHTIDRYVNGPWNYTPHHPPDDELIQVMGEAYAGESEYEVVFGWDWYDIQGDVNDWSYGTKGTFDWTLELMSDTDSQWNINRTGIEGLLSFLFQGVDGVVTDAETNEPLLARVEVNPIGAPVFTDPGVGDFHRVLLPGEYDLRVVAEGYRPTTVTGVQVEADETTTVNVALEKDESLDRYALAVVGMTLPAPISLYDFDTETYLNDTMVWNALGAPDGIPYSLSAHPVLNRVDDASDPGLVVGSIVLDMGQDTPIIDRAGDDMMVVSATSSEDQAAVLVAEADTESFIEVARGQGTLIIDLASSGLDSVRYVKVVDLNHGGFEAAMSGYDLDAVVNLATPWDMDGGDPGGDGGLDDFETHSGGCGCRIAGRGVSPLALWLLTWL